MNKVLITGGSGLVGRRLSDLLSKKGYKVVWLSRKRQMNARYSTYKWDLQKGLIDEDAIADADYIIHLAGAGVADKRWTKQRKKMIVESRTKGGDLIYEYLRVRPNHVKAVICASAVGFYGERGNQMMTENDVVDPSNSFLSEVTQKWEQANTKIAELNKRLVLLRIGIVLAKGGGALPKTALPVKFGLGTYFGKGDMYYSWIHLDDVCRMFIYALENENMKGAYNAVAPNPVTNKNLVKAIAKALKRRFIPMPTPTFMLKATLGEMAQVVTTSTRVSNQKIAKTGFDYTYGDLETALKAIYA
ncbi:MAG: TIGR01777 family oxidoreductase [Chitinophagales bacterium]